MVISFEKFTHELIFISTEILMRHRNGVNACSAEIFVEDSLQKRGAYARSQTNGETSTSEFLM